MPPKIPSTHIPSLDHHHRDVFEMVTLLDNAIRQNNRSAFAPIIDFLVEHGLSHFAEEETLMHAHNAPQTPAHIRDHDAFRDAIHTIQVMYNETAHTTHIAYRIRQLIDQLIHHIITVDIHLKGLPNVPS
jgi:hemerythrin-like metal-binding protein